MSRSILSLLFIIVSLIPFTTADYIRYSIVNITSIEPREWDTDQLRATLNIVSQTQNMTKDYSFGPWKKGRIGVSDQLYRDVPLTGTEPGITVSYALYNVGDKEPQKYGLMIASLVLSIPSRLPVVGAAATVIKAILDIFKGAYECEGPVAVAILQPSRTDIQNMKYDLVSCIEGYFEYDTQRGCENFLPWSTKQSKYRVTHCVERRRGNAPGQTIVTSSAVVTLPRSSAPVSVPRSSSTQVLSSAKSTPILSSARSSSPQPAIPSAVRSSTVAVGAIPNAVTSDAVSRVTTGTGATVTPQATVPPAALGASSLSRPDLVLFDCILGLALIFFFG